MARGSSTRSWLPVVLGCIAQVTAAGQPYQDHTHDSKVFSEPRHYRVFLPAGYGNSTQRYPVIYYFHGHSDRYTLERYDNGRDTVPKIAAFVAAHDVIVVAADGYVARDYPDFYGGAPYDVMRGGGQFDYGEYFRELVHHIDTTWRTLPGRRFRATAGLSMGGFMSLYLSARYPDLVGSASAFNPGPEFYVGEPGRRSLWRPKDHVASHQHTMIRLVRASGDYISQYHEETRAAYAAAPEVDFEFRQDEYHRHWATSIAETFEFHMRAFGNPALDTTPLQWSYASAYREFEAFGYRVTATLDRPALVLLERVTAGGFRVQTRRWAPDGPPEESAPLTVLTAPRYRPGAGYQVLDYAYARKQATIRDLRADAEGRLLLATDGGVHEISITGPGADSQPALLAPLTTGDYLRPAPGSPVHLPIRILNPRLAPMASVRAELASDYPTVEIVRGVTERKSLGPGEVADLSDAFLVKFTAGAGDFARVRLRLKLHFDGGETQESFDVLVPPDPLPPPAEVAVLDGRTRTFAVFRQAGNQGGGKSIERTVTEGAGNGNGLLDPGEEATIWLRLPQGLDPFDKNNWCRAKVYTGSSWLTEVADIQEDKQREWTSGQNRTSLVRLSRQVPAGAEIPLILDCESWSFTFTPDVRYGREPLYQAYQFHRHYLFGWKWTASQSPVDHPPKE